MLGLARDGAGMAPDARVLIDEESVPRHVSFVILRGGFDPARVNGGGYGFGLTVMAERVEALGGRLAVRAREEGGTMVEACIPA